MTSYKVLRPIGPMLNNINLHWHASEASRAGPSWELWDVLKRAGIKFHHLDMGYDSWGLTNDHIRMNITLIDRLRKYYVCLIVVLDVHLFSTISINVCRTEHLLWIMENHTPMKNAPNIAEIVWDNHQTLDGTGCHMEIGLRRFLQTIQERSAKTQQEPCIRILFYNGHVHS